MEFIIMLLSNSLIMSVIMLLLFILTLFARKNTSAKARYMMWIILLLGLVIPFRPILGSGLVRLTGPKNDEIQFVSEETVEFEEEKAVIEEKVKEEVTLINNPDKGYGRSFSWYKFLILTVISIWAGGAIFVFSKKMLGYRRFRKLIKRWAVPISEASLLESFHKIKERMGLSDKNIALIRCSFVGSPMLTGLIKPVIILPDKEMSKEEAELILEHELTHYIHKDLLINLLSIAVLSIHWFNPVIHLCFPSLYGDGESYCDETVLKGKDIKYRRFYGETIIAMIETGKTKPIALSTCFYTKKLNLKRRLFNIMETNKKMKAVSAIAISMVMSLTLLSGSVFVFANAGKKVIGVENAKIIALNDAKVKASEVSFVKEKLDKDDGKKVYDIEFYVGNKEYDYEIDALTGEILEKDMDIENYTIPKKPDKKKQGKFIGMKNAKNIALNDAKLKASEVTFVKAKLDKEDGKKVYDIEFYAGNKEYDYEIDAVTGKILEKDMDIENYSIPSSKQEKSGDIGKNEAKNIAVKHAGINKSNVNFGKVKTDYENGKKVYEIEFYSKDKEYSYEIDAKTGKVLNYEIENIETDTDDDRDDD